MQDQQTSDNAAGHNEGWDGLNMEVPEESVVQGMAGEQSAASESHPQDHDAGQVKAAGATSTTVAVVSDDGPQLQLPEEQTAGCSRQDRGMSAAPQPPDAATLEVQERLQALEVLLREAQQKESALQAEVHTAGEQLDGMRTSLRATEKEAARLKGLLEDRTVQLERLSQRLGEAMQAQVGADDLLQQVQGASAALQRSVARRGADLQAARRSLQQQEADCAAALSQQEQQVEQLKITLKGDPAKEAKAKFRSEIIAILQRRLAALKAEAAALQRQNETLEKRLEAAQHGSPHLHGVVAAEDCRGEGPAKDDKLWVILTQLDSLGHFFDNTSFSLSEKRNALQSECARLEAQEKESARWLADTKISLVATAEEGQRSAPKSQILSMLKQRLTDLRADNARQVERWTAAEQRLAEVQEALRKTEAEREEFQLQQLEVQQTMADQLLNAPEALKCRQQLQEAQQAVEELTRKLQAKDLELQEARQALKAQAQELEEGRRQSAAATTDVAAKYHALQAEFQDLQQEARYRQEQAEIARGELRTKCDQAAELQEQNEALLQELLALKEEQQKRAQSMMQTAQEERTAAVARHRAELQALRQDFDKQLAQMQVEFRTCQQSEEAAQQRVHEAHRQLEEKELAVKQLQTKVEHLQKAKPAPAPLPDAGTLGSRQKEAHLKAFEQEMIGMAQRESSRSYEKLGILPDEGSKRADPNQQYLKNVVLQYLCAKDQEIRGGLIPVLSTMLQFSPEEMQAVWKAHRQWRW
eukprot:EG_transcript_2515